MRSGQVKLSNGRRERVSSNLILVLLLCWITCLGCEGKVVEDRQASVTEPEPTTARPTDNESIPQPVITPSTASEPVNPAVSAMFDRVAVIGASASCGFNVESEIEGPYGPTTAPADLVTAFRAVILADDSVITKQCSFFFFSDPMNVGPALMTQALAEDPTIVIGLDYLFWYGYGWSDVNGKRIADESARLELLDSGLKQLERCTCPVVVGDYPDMRAAIGLMLSATQVPKPETLVLLNNRLREWASDRPNVVVVSLSELTVEMGGDQEAARKYLQRDQLHPTAAGLVLMARRAADAMIASELGVPEDVFERDQDEAMARLKSIMERRGK